MIGGKAPSKYLEQIQQHVQVQLDDASMNEVVHSHLIDSTALRRDDFQSFYQSRKAALLKLISAVMGKSSESVPEDIEDEDDEEAEIESEFRLARTS